jgi:alkylresorcinol/alkylpyrone synthase
MPRIAAIRHALPVHRYRQSDIADTVAELFAEQLDDTQRLPEIFANARISQRHLVMPLDWYRTPCSAAERNRLYLEQGMQLLVRAGNDCLAAVDWPRQQVDQVICVSTTGHATPSLDARLINQLGLRPDTSRLPIWGLGCAAGAAGLSRAYDYCAAYPERVVLLAALECCSLTFIQADLSAKNLIGTALFGDGAAVALVVGDQVKLDGPALRACGSFLFPDSYEIMGWKFVDDGMELVLSPELPELIRRELPPLVKAFLKQHGCTLDEIRHHLAHPGGARVVDAYLQGLGLHEEALRLSSGVLNQVGNLSSVTILLVLEAWLEQERTARKGKGLISAFGPGFSAELLLVEGDG